MTKKDYILLAKGMNLAYHLFRDRAEREYTRREQELVLEGFSEGVTGVMNALKSDNPNFNQNIFINAVTRR